MKCIAGLHTWLSEISARRCCNGFHQELRDISDPKRYEGAEINGVVHLACERLIFVWVRDSLPQETIDALVDKLQFVYTRYQVIEWIWSPQKALEGWTPRALIARGESSRIENLIAALVDGAFL